MIKIFINNKEVFVPTNTTVLDACNSVGIEIPRFCFHQRLSIAGNCRMCLVELEKAPKPIASCTFPVSSNMRVLTNTPLVKKARENVLEFLLINHPLDCPICDQGGECDLQDQTLFFGNANSRFFEFKRSVEDKNCGPLIKTIMTRCIHCTRCVRFFDTIGVGDFGTTNRGRETEIGTYVSKILETELVGNVIDLCPVGALTSKTYAFIARPWELRSAETIDFSDALGSNTRVDFKESEIVRVLPRLNEKLNEEWISDKARFNFDSLKIQRLVSPLSKNEKNTLVSTSWGYGLHRLKALLLDSHHKLNLMFSADVDLATLQTLKKLTNFLGVHKIGFSKKYLINTDFFENFSFNIGLDKISQADFCFLVGTNPRYEASALNLKLKKCFNTGFLNIASLGVPFNLFYTTSVLGVASDVIIKIAEGKHSFCKKFRRSNTPLIILGGSISERYDFFGLQKAALKIRKSATFSNNKWNPFCFLVQEANQYGGFFLGLNDHSCIKKEDFLILNGNLKKEDFYNKELSTGIIFLGSHGSDLLLKACLVLPIKAYLEANGFFMNALGSVQKVEKVSKGPNLARENSKVFENILSSSYTAGVDTKFAPSLISKDNFQKSGFSNIFVEKKRISGKSIISRNPFLPKVTDFYLSGSVSKFSLIMAKCSKMYRAQFKNFFATN